MTQRFFQNPREQSIVKATIVSKYFITWASTIISILKSYEQGQSQREIAYIDLFSGPGRYKDGTPSTPILVLQKALDSQEVCERIHIAFNDGNSDHAATLQGEIERLEGVERLRYRPQVHRIVVEGEIASMLRDWPDIPTLLFVDAWGYKELSLELFESVLQKWGSGCIFFFNYNRINMAFNNPQVHQHIDSLFGNDRANSLRQKLESCDVAERELIILEEFAQTIKQLSADGVKRYVLPFRFRNSTGNKTSHHLIHVSRHFLGYDKMKQIMAGTSSSSGQGIPSFEYNIATERQPFLFSLNRTLEDLEGMLLRDFAGQSLGICDIYTQHSVDTPFIKKNYRQALWNLWHRNAIITNSAPRRKNTFAKHIVATFPRTNTR